MYNTRVTIYAILENVAVVYQTQSKSTISPLRQLKLLSAIWVRLTVECMCLTPKPNDVDRVSSYGMTTQRVFSTKHTESGGSLTSSLSVVQRMLHVRSLNAPIM